MVGMSFLGECKENGMRKNQLSGLICGCVVVLAALASCDDFYSTSWGTEREYDVSKIDLTSGNLEDWKRKAAGNPTLAEKLTEKIISELEGKSSAEKAALQKAGVSLAIEQSGIGSIIIEVAGSDLDNLINGGEDAARDLFGKVQSKSGGVDKAAANIVTIAGKSSITTSGGVPSFSNGDLYADSVSASDVGMAVAVLALAVIPDIDSSTDLSDLSTHLTVESGNVKIVGNAIDEEKTLAAYLNLIADDKNGKFSDNPLTSGLKAAFFGPVKQGDDNEKN
jgi:hypothetical protein